MSQKLVPKFVFSVIHRFPVENPNEENRWWQATINETKVLGEVEANNSKKAFEEAINQFGNKEIGEIIIGDAKINTKVPGQFSAQNIKVGRWYSAKRPKYMPFGGDDHRQVVHLGGDRVQYDSDTVPVGRYRPTVTMESFLRWVKADVTDEVHEKV
jgi:hypothetical protein